MFLSVNLPRDVSALLQLYCIITDSKSSPRYNKQVNHWLKNMEILTCETGVSTIRLVKHVERGNFPMILCRVAKNLLLRKGHSKDLMQLTHISVLCNGHP